MGETRQQNSEELQTKQENKSCKQETSMKFLLIFVAYVSAASDSCCKEKRVGDILYTLAESDMDDETSKFGCKDGCVYTADEDPVDKFCFKDGGGGGGGGGSPITCLDGEKFYWCYE